MEQASSTHGWSYFIIANFMALTTGYLSRGWRYININDFESNFELYYNDDYWMLREPVYPIGTLLGISSAFLAHEFNIKRNKLLTGLLLTLALFVLVIFVGPEVVVLNVSQFSKGFVSSGIMFVLSGYLTEAAGRKYEWRVALIFFVYSMGWLLLPKFIIVQPPEEPCIIWIISVGILPCMVYKMPQNLILHKQEEKAEIRKIRLVYATALLIGEFSLGATEFALACILTSKNLHRYITNAWESIVLAMSFVVIILLNSWIHRTTKFTVPMFTQFCTYYLFHITNLFYMILTYNIWKKKSNLTMSKPLNTVTTTELFVYHTVAHITMCLILLVIKILIKYY